MFEIDMTHIETIWNMSLVDVLVGIHGSGLVNGIFGPETSSMLEIIPVNAPNYARGKGTIMQWIYKHVPQRHAWFKLNEDEQPFQNNRDWQKPFTLKWERLKKFLLYLIDTPNDFCDHKIPQELKNDQFFMGYKEFSNIAPMHQYKPSCGNTTYLDQPFVD